MTWRYTTNPVTCQREWRWYPSVGPAERAVPDVRCVRIPNATVPAFIATPPAAAAVPKIAIAAGLGVAATTGAAGYGAYRAVSFGAVSGSTSAGKAAAAEVSGAVGSYPAPGRTLADVQIPAPVGFADVGAVAVPEPGAWVLVALPFVLVVLGRGFRRA